MTKEQRIKVVGEERIAEMEKDIKRASKALKRLEGSLIAVKEVMAEWKGMVKEVTDARE